MNVLAVMGSKASSRESAESFSDQTIKSQRNSQFGRKMKITKQHIEGIDHINLPWYGILIRRSTAYAKNLPRMYYFVAKHNIISRDYGKYRSFHESVGRTSLGADSSR